MGTLSRIANALKNAWQDNELKVLAYLVIFILLIGMVFFHNVESWNWLDSIYFSVMTLTTVGYGDLAPVTDAGKIFVMVYIFLGLGMLLGFVRIMANHALKFQKESLKRKKQFEKKKIYRKKQKSLLSFRR